MFQENAIPSAETCFPFCCAADQRPYSYLRTTAFATITSQEVSSFAFCGWNTKTGSNSTHSTVFTCVEREQRLVLETTSTTTTAGSLSDSIGSASSGSHLEKGKARKTISVNVKRWITRAAQSSQNERVGMRTHAVLEGVLFKFAYRVVSRKFKMSFSVAGKDSKLFAHKRRIDTLAAKIAFLEDLLISCHGESYLNWMCF